MNRFSSQESEQVSTLEAWALRAERLGDELRSSLPRPLDLLRDIEATLSSLEAERSLFDTFARFFVGEAERLSSRALSVKRDPDGKIRKKLLSAQTKFKALITTLEARRQNAVEDPRLSEEDGVAEAYQSNIVAASGLHNALNALRWAIGEHDADVAKQTGRFENIEELTKHLNRSQ